MQSKWILIAVPCLSWLQSEVYPGPILTKRFQQDGDCWRNLKPGPDQRFIRNIDCGGGDIKKENLYNRKEAFQSIAVSDHTATYVESLNKVAT